MGVSAAVALPWVRRRLPYQDPSFRPKSPVGPFPIWGWGALIWTGFWWLFEWLNRYVLNWHYLAFGLEWGLAVVCFPRMKAG